MCTGHDNRLYDIKIAKKMAGRKESGRKTAKGGGGEREIYRERVLGIVEKGVCGKKKKRKPSHIDKIVPVVIKQGAQSSERNAILDLRDTRKLRYAPKKIITKATRGKERRGSVLVGKIMQGTSATTSQ